MLKYTFQRILTFIPMLIAISLLSFVISINAPGDPVERLAKSAESEGSAQEQSGAPLPHAMLRTPGQGLRRP